MKAHFVAILVAGILLMLSGIGYGLCLLTAGTKWYWVFAGMPADTLSIAMVFLFIAAVSFAARLVHQRFNVAIGVEPIHVFLVAQIFMAVGLLGLLVVGYGHPMMWFWFDVGGIGVAFFIGAFIARATQPD